MKCIAKVDELECLGGRVDGCGAVELAEDRVFGRPEADGEGDRLGESGVGIGELDGVSQLEECGVLVEGLADGVIKPARLKGGAPPG